MAHPPPHRSPPPPHHSPSAQTPLLPPASSPVPFHLHKLPPASWAYPFYGILYLLAHPALLPPLISRILPLTLLSLFVLTLIFTTLYLPQVALLHFFNGPLAWINAAALCLSEAAAIITFIAENFMTEEKIVDTFDGVLVQEAEKLPMGLQMHVFAMLARLREMRLGQERAMDKLGKHTESPYLRFSCRLTVEFICELPLNLVPLVGPPLFILLQGYHLGPLSHYRYIQLNGLSKSQKKKFINLNRWRYWLFGIVHVFLQITPVLSIFFLFTSAVGAALWAVEDQKRLWERGERVEERRKWWWRRRRG